MIEFFDYTYYSSWIVISVIGFSLFMIGRVMSTIYNIINDNEFDGVDITKLIISVLIIIFFTFILSMNFQDNYKQQRAKSGTSLLDIKRK